MQGTVRRSAAILSEEAIQTQTNTRLPRQGRLTLLSRRRDPRKIGAVSDMEVPVKETIGNMSRGVYGCEVTS